MSCYHIVGGTPLAGRLGVQGAKNSVLPILAACLLAPGQSVIHNCPDLSDVAATLEILRLLGCGVRREGPTVLVDATAPCRCEIPDALMREMRSSVLFLGALMARMGAARLCCPGGCQLGPRPIDLHLAALRDLGAEITEDHTGLYCKNHGMVGRELCLALPSVGATENIMLAACGCAGTTRLVGAAREPEIVDLQRFLRAMGARVCGAGGSVITIEGGYPLHPAEHRVMEDRIAAATYLSAAAAAGGELELTGCDPRYLSRVLAVLEEGGCQVRRGRRRVFLCRREPLRGVRSIHTAPYPGFPTDAQALVMAVLAGGTGNAMFVENMFDSRYRHVDELRRMGADIQVSGRVAVVTGTGGLHGAQVQGTDLRGAAALVVAALGAQGDSRVSGLDYLRRGYQNLEADLRALGARIRLERHPVELT